MADVPVVAWLAIVPSDESDDTDEVRDERDGERGERLNERLSAGNDVDIDVVSTDE